MWAQTQLTTAITAALPLSPIRKLFTKLPTPQQLLGLCHLILTHQTTLCIWLVLAVAALGVWPQPAQMVVVVAAAVTPEQLMSQFLAAVLLPWLLGSAVQAALLDLMGLRALQLLLVHIRLAAVVVELLELLALRLAALAAPEQLTTAAVAAACQPRTQLEALVARAAVVRQGQTVLVALVATIRLRDQPMLAQAVAEMAAALRAATHLAQLPAAAVTDTLARAAAELQRPHQPAPMAVVVAVLMLGTCRALAAQGLTY